MPKDTTRTVSFYVYTPLAAPPWLEVERELAREYEGGDKHRLALSRLIRPLSALNATALPAGPRTVATYADLFALLADCTAALGEEEIALRAEAAEKADAANRAAQERFAAARAREELEKTAKREKGPS